MLVTNGSMQADAFLFEHLVRPGDEVLVERPTYDRTLLSLRQRGARLHAVELQPDGIDTEALARLLSGPVGARPKLAHIIPNFQNPAGYTLSLAKRRTLLELAADLRVHRVRGRPLRGAALRGESLPTMLSMDPDRVVYASSFSKTICPGIRVGYLVGPREVIDAIAKMATNTYISPDMVAQAIVYEFCASGAIDRSIETVRTALAERAATLAKRSSPRAGGGRVRRTRRRLLHVGDAPPRYRRARPATGRLRARGVLREGHRLPAGGRREHAPPRLLRRHAPLRSTRASPASQRPSAHWPERAARRLAGVSARSAGRG